MNATIGILVALTVAALSLLALELALPGIGLTIMFVALIGALIVGCVLRKELP